MWFCECLTQFCTRQQANDTSTVDTGYRKTGLVWKRGTPAALSTPSCLLLVVLSSSPGISKPHRGPLPFRIAASLHPSLVPTCNTSTGKQLNFSWNCISSVREVSCFIAYWLHIPRTRVVLVKTLIKVSELFTKEELCKILCLCQNVLPSPAMLNKNFWLQVHTIKPLSTRIVLFLHFMEPKEFLLSSRQPATYSSPEPDESRPCPPIPFKIPPILSSHLYLDLLSDFFSSGFSTKIQHALFFSPTRHMTQPSHLPWFELPNIIQTGKHSFLTAHSWLFNHLESKLFLWVPTVW